MVTRARLEPTDTTHLEAFAPPQNQVAQRNANILVENLAMSLWSIVVSENLHGADDSYTWGVSGDQDHALLVVNVGVVRIALAHDDVNLCPRVSSPTNPPTTRDENLTGQGESS